MRILLIGKSYPRQNGLRNLFYTQRFYNGLIRNGHFVHFYDISNEIKTNYDLKHISLKKRVDKANGKLLELVKNLKIDVILIAHTTDIQENTIYIIRQQYPHIRIAYLFVDALFTPHNLPYMQRTSDAVFLTTGGAILDKLSTESCPLHFFPNVTDTSIDTWQAWSDAEPLYDVAAYMNASCDHDSDHTKRVNSALRVKEIPEIKTFYRSFDGNPPIHGFEYFKSIGQSAMTLCLNRHACAGISSTPETRYMYASDRISHVMGNGSLALVYDDFNLDKLYHDDEVVYFNSDDELVEKVKFYKQNPAARQKIARKGWEKAHHIYNETNVMKYVMDVLLQQETDFAKHWSS